MRRRTAPNVACRNRERGVALPMVAVSLVVLIIAASFTVDLGRLMTRRRDLQLVADIAALDAVRSLDGRSGAAQQLSIEQAAARSAERNHFAVGPERRLTVRLGRVDDAGRFVALGDPAADVPTAVEVTAGDTVPFLLAAGARSTTRAATAVSRASAGIVLGSGLLGGGGSCADSSGNAANANSTLGALLGGAVSLDAVSYHGVACTRITLGELAIAAGVADADALLDTQLTVRGFLDLAADALAARPASSERDAAVLALRTLALSASAAAGSSPLSLAGLVSVADDSASRYADVSLDLGALVQGAILLGRDGRVVSVPGATAAVPGVLSVTADVGIVEPPQIVVGPLGSSVSTAQVRLRVTADLGELAGIGHVRLPLLVEAAAAHATLLAVRCSERVPSAVDVAVDTDGARIMIGSMSDGELAGGTDVAPAAAPIVSLLGLPVLQGATTVSLAGTDETVTFTGEEIGTTRRVSGGASAESSGSLALAGLPLTGPVLAVLTPALDSVLTNLVTPLLDTLGVQLAYADVRVFDPTCPTPRLVS